MRQSVIERYSEISKFDFISFIDDMKNFMDDDYPEIELYFKKGTEVAPTNSINNLKSLKNRYFLAVNALKNLIDSEENVTIEHFSIQEYIDSFESMIGYVENLPRYLKTSRDNVYITKRPMLEYKVTQGDTLESIALKFYNDESRWVDIAKENDISYYEVASSTWIGKIIKVPLKRINLTDVVGVIDALIGENMLGMDIKKEFVISDDDIETLSGDDTFEQSCAIMFGLSRGDIPEFPQVGHILNELIGSNLGIVSNSALVADLKRLFYSDPTVKLFTVSRVSLGEDSISMDFYIRNINDGTFNSKNYQVNI